MFRRSASVVRSLSGMETKLALASLVGAFLVFGYMVYGAALRHYEAEEAWRVSLVVDQIGRHNYLAEQVAFAALDALQAPGGSAEAERRAVLDAAIAELHNAHAIAARTAAESGPLREGAVDLAIADLGPAIDSVAAAASQLVTLGTGTTPGGAFLVSRLDRGSDRIVQASSQILERIAAIADPPANGANPLRRSDQTWFAVIVLLLYAAAVVLLVRQRLRRANESMASQSRELARLALIAKRTSNAVNILDAKGRIEWVNEGFIRITGYSFEEARGHVPGAFLRCELTDPAAAAAIDSAIRNGTSVRQELINRGKTGRTYWLDVEMQPLLDEDGKLTGFMAIETEITEAKSLHEALTNRNTDLEMMSELSGVGAWRLDLSTQALRWSGQVRAIHEVDDDFAPTLERALDFFPGEARERMAALVQSSIEARERWDVELPLVTAKGREIWVRVLGKPVIEGGEVRSVAGAVQDITTAVNARETLQRTQERLELAARGANIGLWDWHRVDNRTWISADWWQHLGYPQEHLPETLAEAGDDPLHADEAERVTQEWTAFIDGKVEQFQSEFRLRDGAGNWRWVQSIGRTTKRLPDGSADRASGVFIDIEERKRADEQRVRDQQHLWALANVDSLTGLPNRAHYFAELDDAIRKAARKARSIVVGIMDIDRFKEVNDSFGHAIGDEYLIKIAARLRDAVQPGDLVARLSGDEFAFFLSDPGDSDATDRRLQRLLAAVCEPVDLSNLAKRGGGSIGVALYPQDAATTPELLRRADIALYAAKTTGRRSWRRFLAPMEAHLTEGRNVRHDFESAIENNQILVFYQPVISGDQQSIQGFEALARWNHPVKRVIGPSEFSSVLLEPELARLLGQRVRSLVFEQIANWRKAGVAFGRVGINVVASDFKEGGLANDLFAAVDAGILAPSELTIEVTEGVLLDGSGNTRIRDDLFSLKRAGFEIAFDDFGTGYASLSHLREYPIDRLKIDRSFVMGLPGSERDLEIVRTIGTLAGALGLGLTAEGVETEEQADIVRKLGATELQGYLFSKPMHPQRVPSFIARFNSGIDVWARHRAARALAKSGRRAIEGQ